MNWRKRDEIAAIEFIYIKKAHNETNPKQNQRREKKNRQHVPHKKYYTENIRRMELLVQQLKACVLYARSFSNSVLVALLSHSLVEYFRSNRLCALHGNLYEHMTVLLVIVFAKLQKKKKNAWACVPLYIYITRIHHTKHEFFMTQLLF